MAHVLRGGIGDAALISYSAVENYQREQSREQHPEPKNKRPKTRRQMKGKIVRGRAGAIARGGYTTPTGQVKGGLIRVPETVTIIVSDE